MSCANGETRVDLLFYYSISGMILESYWKKKFGIPFIIDMQYPWDSEYYQDKPKSERPKKHWFSYRLNKLLEKLDPKS